MQRTVITRAGLSRLSDELARLETDGRAEAARRLREAAAAETNLAENTAFHEEREHQAMLERRIALLAERIAAAELATPDADNGVVDVGERVRLRDLQTGELAAYEVVGRAEADASAGRISNVSPLGRALVGLRAGQVAVVEAPAGPRRVEILEIEAVS